MTHSNRPASHSTLKVFAVFDAKAEAYLNPFFAGSTGIAIRMFESAAHKADHDFHRYAPDYTLFELGTWCQLTGKFEALPAQLNLGNALQFQGSAGSGDEPMKSLVEA